LAQLLLDTETGLLLAFRSVEDVQGPTDRYRVIASYGLKSYAGHTDAGIFQGVASDRKAVKNLTAWRASRIQKVLGGKAAPELNVMDMRGNRISLAELKGKTILLDFWATWCPPCRDDAPDLEKLHRKYGDRELAIVGVSVGEDRVPVEAYLRGRAHEYPNVLAIEHDLPRPYQVEVLPTYIVIDRNGNVSAATEGDQGFNELRRLLKKAGLDVD
jgi:thiol-disulfide isomerase/thioredoxin